MPTVITLLNFLNGEFNTYQGGAPQAGLIKDAAGDFFGTTSAGGTNGGYGTVFELVPNGGGYALNTLVSFDGTDGQDPVAGLIQDSAGNLIGTTEFGGTAGDGTVFEIVATPGGYASTPITLATFNGTNGSGPVAGLVADSAGDLFGTTSSGGAAGGGTVFEIAKSANGYVSPPTTLASFSNVAGNPTPEFPRAGLIVDSAGDLFGTTEGGGPTGNGTIFELAKTTSGYVSAPTTLLNFTGSNGSAPVAGLIADNAGNLFGTTQRGGVSNKGTIFELVNNGGVYTLTTLVSFNGNDGAGPTAGLIEDRAGNLFGTTNAGGANNLGTAFKISKANSGYAATPTILASFDSTDGQYPNGGLTADSAGNLLTTTSSGGAYSDGTIVEIADGGFVLCFLAGTQISTPEGEVAVEQLTVGGSVLNYRGDVKRIVWIGMGRVLATRGRRNAATPVIVQKNALADNIPHRDLRVTKAHSLYIDGALIPVEFLVNHRTILWDDHAQEVQLYHIELETHDVLIANGALAESYRDDGNRWLFRNASGGWGLPPQEPYAPVLTGGPTVDAAWRHLLDRSGPRPGVPTTDDPDLHLIVDGQRVDAAGRRDALHIFRLEANPATVRICSRTGVPQELGVARDPRCLGVALRQITVCNRKRQRTMKAINPLLAHGFHCFEPDQEIRWTDGDAAIPSTLLAEFTGPTVISLLLGGSTTYVDEGIRQIRRVA